MGSGETLEKGGKGKEKEQKEVEKLRNRVNRAASHVQSWGPWAGNPNRVLRLGQELVGGHLPLGTGHSSVRSKCPLPRCLWTPRASGRAGDEQAPGSPVPDPFEETSQTQNAMLKRSSYFSAPTLLCPTSTQLTRIRWQISVAWKTGNTNASKRETCYE